MGFLYSQFIPPPFPTTPCTSQTIIVTGSNVGLGKEAARHFARLGAAKIILAVRNTKAGEDAKTDIETSTGCDAKVLEVWNLDLASYDSCKAFAERAEKLNRIDVLLENAALATRERSLAESHERTITVNVISTFYLAMLLLPKLKSTANDFGIHPRLVIVSSGVHAWPKFPFWNEPDIFASLDDPSKSPMSERYSVSKLLEVLVVRHIAPKLEGSGVVLNMLNPGLCHSELARDAGWGLAILKFFFARTTEVGSRTLVAAANAGEESHGKYMDDSRVSETELSPFVRSVEGGEAGARVWEELRGILEGIQPGVVGDL